MADEKRFSQDFTHWTEALAHGMRLMIENDQTGTEYYATLQQVLNYVIAYGGSGGSSYGGVIGTEQEMDTALPGRVLCFFASRIAQ